MVGSKVNTGRADRHIAPSRRKHGARGELSGAESVGPLEETLRPQEAFHVVAGLPDDEEALAVSYQLHVSDHLQIVVDFRTSASGSSRGSLRFG